MPRRPHMLAVLLGVLVGVLVAAPDAFAAPAPAGVQPGRAVHAARSDAGSDHGGSLCGVIELPVIGPAASKLVCEGAGEALGAAGGLVGEAAGELGDGVLDGVAAWMIGAATQVTTFVAAQMQQTTTPQLQSAWFEAQWRPLADLAAGLALLVTLIALAGAAIRRSPQALAATLAGVARAGIGTGLVIPLTVIGLDVADQVSGAVLSSAPHAFWASVAHAWGTGGFGGFGSSALAALIAAIEVLAAIFVWLELIARDAAIYMAVLFFATGLAAAIWPPLAAWPGRLGRLLLLFVILKPVAVIVLSLAGNAAAAGLSFAGGVSGSVGTILAAIVIFALAAFAPWTLMYLLAADAESAYMAAGMRAATAAAVADPGGRSLRTGGGLSNLARQDGGAPGGRPPGAGGAPGGGHDGPPGGDSPPHGGGGGPAAGGEGAGATGAAGGDGALTLTGETIGAGAVGAAAGADPRSTPASDHAREPSGEAADAHGSPAHPGVESAPGEPASAGRDVSPQASTVRSAAGGDGGRSSPRPPARVSSGGPRRAPDTGLEQEQRAGPGAGARGPVSGVGGGVPPAETGRVVELAAWRRGARRTGAPAGRGPRRPAPARPGDEGA